MFKYIGLSAATLAVKGVTNSVTSGNLKKRLGGGSKEDQKRAVNKVAVLKTLAFRDGTLTSEEKMYIYDYIINHPHLPSDRKIELLQEVEEQLPASFKSILKSFSSEFNFDDLFSTKEEANGFVKTMLDLANIDGNIDSSEMAYIKEICKSCKVPEELIP